LEGGEMEVELSNYKIYHGDCLDIMQQLDKESIDLTVTSPPYDNLKTYNGSLEWSEDIWKSVIRGLWRITKKGGVVVWVVGDATIKGSETGTSFKQALYFKECGFNLHDTMIWNKPNVFNFGSNLCYKQAFEFMFIFSKGKPKTLNLIKDIHNESKGKELKGGRKHSDGSRDNTPSFVGAEFKKRSNVWGVNVTNNGIKHPAIFPSQLAIDHIISWSNEGDTVLDPFMGSGTTGIAALQNDRKFIGIEKDESYFRLSLDRIEKRMGEGE
jgi:site-specific DNA-methyltransferase (adenine-specific)